MKSCLIFLSFLFFPTLLNAQNFEGKVIYKNTYISKIPTIPDQQLTSMLGNTTEHYFKNGSYKRVTNGTFLQWQLYVNKDNKLYNKFAIGETLLWNDCATNPNEFIKSEIKKGVLSVLGYLCDEVTLLCAHGSQKYYFNSKLGADAKAFAKHNFYNLNKYLTLSHAIPLKTIIEIEQFTVVSEATEIKEMKLDDNFFKLPANVETAPSPY